MKLPKYLMERVDEIEYTPMNDDRYEVWLKEGWVWNRDFSAVYGNNAKEIAARLRECQQVQDQNE